MSKRTLTLGRDFAGQSTPIEAINRRHSPVTQWRVEHGFSEQPDQAHVCSGRCIFVHVVDNVYLCEKCGREHVCDEHCGERVLDTANGLPVCPISGMCFDHQLDAAWEVSLQATSCATCQQQAFATFDANACCFCQLSCVENARERDQLSAAKCNPYLRCLPGNRYIGH